MQLYARRLNAEYVGLQTFFRFGYYRARVSTLLNGKS